MVASQDATGTPDPCPDSLVAPRGLGRTPYLINFAVIVGFAALLAATLLRHEMWRDEIQAWSIANSSSSLRDLFHNLRYEGHPVLWYLLLFPVARAFDAPEAMQALQFVVGVGAVALLVSRSPFTRVQRTLLPFGFFLAFEFGTLSRSYGLGTLLVFATCAAANKQKRCWPLLGLLIGLLSLTSAFGALVGLAILTGLVVDERYRNRSRTDDGPTLNAIAIGTTIAVMGMIAAYFQSVPPNNAGEFRGWRTNVHAGDISSTIASIWRAFIPIPKFEREFWNTNIADGHVGLAAIVSILIFASVIKLFSSKPGALAMWAVGVASTLVFTYSKIGYASSGRHYGHLFLLLVAMYWIAPSLQASTQSIEGQARISHRRSELLTAVLLIHLVAGLFAVSTDLFAPFSDGKSVAKFLQSSKYTSTAIVGYPDNASSTVAGYLQRDIFFPQGGRSGSYVIWDKDRKKPSDYYEQLINAMTNQDGSAFLLLRNEPVAELSSNVDLIESFADGIVSDEHFWLYRVIPADS